MNRSIQYSFTEDMARLLLPLAVAAAVWLVIGWPIPRHARHGISVSAHNVERGAVRTMIPGDPLQLLYHFWLAGDMVAGNTRPFYNLYEFNDGNDEARRDVGSYYAPFSLVYSLAAWLGGMASGWNFVQFFSLWLSAAAIINLCRRFTDRLELIVPAAVLHLSFPYRWIAMLGGSPSGLAMAWIPLMAVSIFDIFAERRWTAGILAAAVMVFASWTDKAVFMFGVLSMPLWALLGMIYSEDFPRPSLRGILQCAAIASVPAAAIAASYYFVRHVDRSVSLLPSQWPIQEIMLFSPAISGLLGLGENGLESPIYSGWVFAILLLAALAAAAWSLARQRRFLPEGAALLLLAGAAVLVALLAAGMRGPGYGIVFRAARRIIPPMAHVRQPAKIFALMPTLAAMTVAVAAGCLDIRRLSRAWRFALPLLASAALLTEYKAVIRPTISRLVDEEPAYLAAASDAAERETVPRALVIPLWPGTSSWSSPYLHYASLYRIRLVNGYSPAPPANYRKNVYEPLRSANRGVLSESQMDWLTSRGIFWLIFHEDLFQKKISPFSGGLTLSQFLSNPRLKLLRQTGPVWTFRIEAEPAADRPQYPEWPVIAPTSMHEFENRAGPHVEVGNDTSASGGMFAKLKSGDEPAVIPTLRFPCLPESSLLVRARGTAKIRATLRGSNGPSCAGSASIEDNDWTWVEFAFGCSNYVEASTELAVESGTADLDSAVLAYRRWNPPPPGAAIFIPAAGLIHAGWTDISDGGVCLRADWDPSSAVLDGPNLPFETGVYEIAMEFETEAPSGTDMGALIVTAQGTCDRETRALTIAGEPCRVVCDHRSNLPIRVVFEYSRSADMKIRGLRITRPVPTAHP